MPAALSESFDPSREEEELRAYLGDEYDQQRLWQSEQTLAQEVESVGDEDRFYRVSQGYLYNLTAFAMSATKLPYLEVLTRHVPPGGKVLDYGCGIGSDGLLLLEAGYRVEFADFDNPSTEYLRWRLRRRGLDAPIHDLDGDVPSGFDATFAFDVLEHVENPFAMLGEMERRARLVEVNLLEPAAHDDQEIHHDLPLEDLVQYAASHRLLMYETFHGSSHLIVYKSWRLGPASRLLGAGRRWTWLARRRVAQWRLSRRR